LHPERGSELAISCHGRAAAEYMPEHDRPCRDFVVGEKLCEQQRRKPWANPAIVVVSVWRAAGYVSALCYHNHTPGVLVCPSYEGVRVEGSFRDDTPLCCASESYCGGESSGVAAHHLDDHDPSVGASSR
jgi:hypothetical protein